MDINTLGFMLETDSCSGYGEVDVHLMIFRENTPYRILLGIKEEYTLGEKKKMEEISVYFQAEDAREIGEKLIFLADLAEKANMESEGN